MRPAFVRVDHVICMVADIHAAYQHFHEVLGFPIAWPIGHFWPSGQTCGFGLGGVNLEFHQPNEGWQDEATITTIAFQPSELNIAMAAFEAAGIPAKLFEKSENDPDKLLQRGFSYEESQTVQEICTNISPDVSRLPIPFFACQYSIFLQQHLNPLNPRLQGPYGAVSKLVIGLPNPARLVEIFQLGYEGPPALEGIQSDKAEVVEIHFEKGPVDLKGFNAGFRFS